MAKILIVEDSKDAQMLVARALDQHQLQFAGTLKEAEASLKKPDFDLVLLDLTLPDGNGFDLCGSLEKRGFTQKTPVIMLTAKSDVADKVSGLAIGADDYIAKPFDIRELKARVEAVLRRREKSGAAEIFHIGNLLVNMPEQKVFFEGPSGTQPLDLTPIEFKILTRLGREHGEVVSRDELYNFVWGKNVHLSVRNIDTHVCKLRQKVEMSNVQIKSSRGTGYQLKAPLAPLEEKKIGDARLPQGVPS